MRVSVKVATAMGCGVSRIPIPKWNLDQCYGEGDKMDEGKLRRALDIDGVVFSDSDNGPVFCIVNEFLQSLERVVVTQQTKATEEKERTESEAHAFNRGVRKCMRKMDSKKYDKVFYVRFDVDWVGRTGNDAHVRFMVNLMNPYGLVGTAESYARTFAIDATRLLLHMRDRFLKNTGTVVEVREGKGADGLITESEKQNAWFEERDRFVALRDEMLDKRNACKHRRFDRCVPLEDGTPPNCKCCLYCSGKCKIPTLPDEYEEYT